MKKRAKILTLVLALAMLFSILAVVTVPASAEETPTKLYLKPNSNWTQSGARFAAYFFGNGEKWVSMTKNSDGYYEVEAPAGYPNVIFCRMNPSAAANNWNNKWNQTADLTVPTGNKTLYTVSSNYWDGSDNNQWSVYCEAVNKHAYDENTGICAVCGASDPSFCAHSSSSMFSTATCTSAGVEYLRCDDCGEPQSEETPVEALGHNYENRFCTRCGYSPFATGVYLPGSFNSWNQEKDQFLTENEGDSVSYVTLTLAANTTYEFKVKKGGDWLSASKTITATANNSNLSFSSSTQANCKITTSVAGEYTFIWNGSTLSVEYPHVHVWSDATCTEAQKCECGETQGEALGHTWVDADCDTPKTCSVCFATEGEALGHTWVDADCDTPKTCSVCSETDGDALGHSYVAGVCTVCGGTDPDYCEHEYTYACDKRCIKCGNLTREEADHNIEHVEAKAATCTANGNVEYWNCTICGYAWTDEALQQQTNLKSVVVPAAHTYTYPCDAHCSVCYELTNEDAAHSIIHVEAKAATCTAEGNLEHWYCEHCGTAWTDEALQQQTNLKSVVTPMVDHVYVEGVCECGKVQTMTIYFENNWMWPDANVYFWNAKGESNAAWPGVALANPVGKNDQGYNIYAIEIPVNTTGIIFSGTGEYGYEQCNDITEIHACYCYYMTYDSATNTKPAGHYEYHQNEIVTNDPTCLDPGSKTTTCTVCGATSTEEIAPVHGNIIHVEAKAATCYENGNFEYWYCEDCGFAWLDEACTLNTNLMAVVLPMAHAEATHVAAVAPTCTAEGNIEYWLCEACGQAWLDEACTLNTNVLAVKLPAAHNYESEVTTAPGCTTEGLKTYTCSCGDSYTEVLPAYHNGNLVHVPAKDPVDCATPGNIEHYTCPSCNEYFSDANANNMINPWYISITLDCVRPEGVADCAEWTCETCGNENYGSADHNTGVAACQDGTCSKCGANVEGYGCVNYDTPACQDGVCYYCGGFVAGLGHENGAWAPCLIGECSYGCGLTYPATAEHVDEDADDYCDTCWNHLNHDVDPCKGGECSICWTYVEPAHVYFYPCDPVCMICYEITNPDATHNVVHVEAVAATCYENGNVEYWYCSDCGATWADEAQTQVTNQMNIVVPMAHKPATHVAAVAPTCYENGNIEYWYCEACGQAWLDEACTLNTNLMAVVLPMAHAEATHVAAKDATCTELGNIEYWYCEACGQAWLDADCTLNTNLMAVKLPMVDHSYTDGVCGICGAEDPDYEAPVYVAEVNGTKYESLQDALNAGGEVKLLCDVALDAPIVVAKGNSVTLDLNGFVLSYESTTQGEAMITNRGTLVINDSVGNGEIYYNYVGAADSTYGKGNYTISNGGHLTVNGGKIYIANLRAHAKYPIDNNSTSGDAILVINGGHLYNYNTSAIRQFCNSTTNKNSVTINGGLIEAYCSIWVQNPGKNTVHGSLTITGGEIRTTAAAYVNGTAELKDVSSRIYFTIDGDGGAWAEGSAMVVTGGTFNENVSLATEAPAVLSVGNGATYNGRVELPANRVVNVNGVGYASLADALAAANDGDVIALEADVVFDDVLTLSANATIDLNGHKLTANGFVLFNNDANLVDSSALQGLLVVPQGNIVANNHNSNYVPVLTAEGYKIAAVKDQFKAIENTENSFVIDFRPSLGGSKENTVAILENGALDNGISIFVRVRCYDANGNVTASFDYDAADELIARVYTNGTTIRFTLKGAGSAYAKYSVSFVVASNTGVLYDSEAVYFANGEFLK